MKGWGAWVGILVLCAGNAAAGMVEIVAVRSADLPAYDQAIRGFEKSLSLQGVEAHVRVETLPKTPAEAKSFLMKIDKDSPTMILALGSMAAQAARTNVHSVPVLFCMVLDPSDELTYGGASLSLPLSEYVTWIYKSLPEIKKVGLIYHPGHARGMAQDIQALEKKGVLAAVPATSPTEVSRAMKALKGRADCLLLMPDPDLFPLSTLGAFLSQSIGEGMPVVGVSPSYVKAGAIAAFFADYEDNGQQAARAAARLIRGEDLQKIPVMAPTKVSVSLNMAIARHMNRSIADDAFRVAMDVVR